MVPDTFFSGLDHIGIAVRSIDEARRCFESLFGAVFEQTEEVAEQQVRIAWLRIGTGPAALRLELLEPTSVDSPVGKFLASRGPGVHHVALATAGLDRALAVLAAADTPLIDPTPRRGAHGARIAFLHPRAAEGVLVELCEHAPRSKDAQAETP